MHNETDSEQNRKLNKYVENSVPKISIPGNHKCNHFELVTFLKENGYIKERHKIRWGNSGNLDKTLLLLNTEFKKLFTKERSLIINKVLKLRYQKLNNIIQ